MPVTQRLLLVLVLVAGTACSPGRASLDPSFLGNDPGGDPGGGDGGSGGSDGGTPTTPLARLHCTADTFPDCGWTAVAPNDYYARRFITGGGPDGLGATELTQRESSDPGQYYLGWYGPVLPSPSPGAVRYLRMHFRAASPVNFDGTGDVWTDKLIIVGDGDNPTGRVICTLRDNGVVPDRMAIFCSRNIDGYPNRTDYVTLPNDTWVALQFEMRSAATTSSGDGQLKIWMNQPDYATPTVQSEPFQLDAIYWGNVNVGYYANATLAASGNVVFQISDVEWDDAFDPSYH